MCITSLETGQSDADHSLAPEAVKGVVGEGGGRCKDSKMQCTNARFEGNPRATQPQDVADAGNQGKAAADQLAQE